MFNRFPWSSSQSATLERIVIQIYQSRYSTRRERNERKKAHTRGSIESVLSLSKQGS